MSENPPPKPGTPRTREMYMVCSATQCSFFVPENEAVGILLVASTDAFWAPRHAPLMRPVPRPRRKPRAGDGRPPFHPRPAADHLSRRSDGPAVGGSLQRSGLRRSINGRYRPKADTLPEPERGAIHSPWDLSTQSGRWERPLVGCQPASQGSVAASAVRPPRLPRLRPSGQRRARCRPALSRPRRLGAFGPRSLRGGRRSSGAD